MLRSAVTVALSLAVLPAGAQNFAAGSGAAGIQFPFRSGVEWIYSGTAKSSEPGAGEESRSTTLRAEITEVVRRDFVIAALIRGCPLGMLQPDAPAAECAVLQVGSGLLYLVEAPRTSEVLRRLHDRRDELVGLLHESELVVRFPLSIGQRIGETAQLTRECPGAPAPANPCPFSWNVTTARPAQVTRPGGPSAETPVEYELRWQGQTGYKILRFTNGIGITGFAFDHGPSGSAAGLTLVAYRPDQQ